MNNFEKAVCMPTATRLFVDDWRLFTLLRGALMARREYLNAGKDFKSAIKTNENYPDRANDAGIPAMNLGNYSTSELTSCKEIEVGPVYSKVYSNLGI